MRLTDFNEKITAKSLNEGLTKKYGQRIAVENYSLEELHSARNKLRTQMRDIETNESFNAVDGPVYQKTKSFLDVLNAEIHERENIQEAGKPDFLDLDKDGNKKEPMKKAAKDAKGGKTKSDDKKGMSDKQKKYFGKKNESIEEGSLEEDARELMAFLKDQGITDVDPKLQLAIRDYFYDKKKTAPKTGSTHPRYGQEPEQDWDWKGALEAEADALMKAGYDRERAYAKAYKKIESRRAWEKGGSAYNSFKRHYKKIDDLRKRGDELRARRDRGESPKGSSDEQGLIRSRNDANSKRMGRDEKAVMASMEEQVQNSIVNALMEGEEEKAALVMASKDMVDKVTSWMEDTAEMQTESMLELGDKIRDEQDSATSEQFINTVKPALEALFTALETARGQLSNGVAIVTGEGDNMMGGDTDMDMDMDVGDEDDMEPTVDDEFGVADASAGGEQEAGREKRESVERSRKLGTLLSKKKS